MNDTVLAALPFATFATWAVLERQATSRLHGLMLWLGLVLQAHFAVLYGWAPAPTLLVVILLLAAAVQVQLGGTARRRLLAWAGTAGFVLLWLLFKYVLPLVNAHVVREVSVSMRVAGGAFLGLESYAMAGLSYIGFKLIHFRIDVRTGEISDAKPVEVLTWLLFFPSILAGPIQRYPDWIEQRRARSPLLEQWSAGLRRVAEGLFLKLVLAGSIQQLTLPAYTSGELAQAPWWVLAGGSFAYTVYLYWDFAGYTSVAIGLGLFFGIRLPENFDRPYRATDLTAFWQRWHMSLSSILRDYLYYDLSLNLKRRPFFRRNRRLAAFLPAFATFFAIGLWHGPTLGFLVFGFLHGVGVGWLAAFPARPRDRRGPIARWWHETRLGRGLAWGTTWAYIVGTFFFFCLGDEALLLALGW